MSNRKCLLVSSVILSVKSRTSWHIQIHVCVEGTLRFSVKPWYWKSFSICLGLVFTSLKWIWCQHSKWEISFLCSFGKWPLHFWVSLAGAGSLPSSSQVLCGSSPRSCVGQEKPIWNVITMSRGFLVKGEYWVTCWTETQPVLDILGWDNSILFVPSPRPPSKGRRILSEKYCEISKWKVGDEYYLSCGVCWKKNWMQEQMEWEEMGKQWKEKNCF